MGCTGGGWRKGGGEESGYFSAYSSCAASVILVLWRIVPYPTQKPPPEVQPPLDGSAFVLGPACPSRNQGEHTGDAYIYVQYLKAVNQIQTLKFSFFHFDKYAFIMTLKKKTCLGIHRINTLFLLLMRVGALPTPKVWLLVYLSVLPLPHVRN